MWIQYARYKCLFYTFLTLEPFVKCSLLRKRNYNLLFQDFDLNSSSQPTTTTLNPFFPTPQIFTSTMTATLTSTLRPLGNISVADPARNVSPTGCQPSICTVEVAVSSMSLPCAQILKLSQSYSLYVWAQESSTTDCLPTVPSLPQVTAPPGLNP